jgi:hypothetical protein
MSTNIYEKLNKPSTATISKAEFIQWGCETLETVGAASLENVYDLFLTGGPKVEVEDPNGLPKLYQSNEPVRKAPAQAQISAAVPAPDTLIKSDSDPMAQLKPKTPDSRPQLNATAVETRAPDSFSPDNIEAGDLASKFSEVQISEKSVIKDLNESESNNIDNEAA